MRQSRFHAPTLKEAPKEAEIPSHALLLRAGYIRKLAAGVYDFLPLSIRVLNKITAIIREELNRAGAQEVLLPAVQPAELWQESGRWEKYGPELLRFKDRKGGDFCLGPTHEEVIVDLVRRDVNSYKQLPINLYQIQAKFRDEIRPRAGLMRGREFIMKDAYSFDASDEGAKQSYEWMRDAYVRIFERCGLDFRVVDADGGNIGGARSQEFQVLADTGEDSIVACSQCDYSANVEKAELGALDANPASGVSVPSIERVDTPGVGSIEEVSAYLDVASTEAAKTLMYRAGEDLVAAVIRGDRAVNEVKLRAFLDADSLELADAEAILRVIGVVPGFVGPVDIPAGVRVVVDQEIAGPAGWIVGANTVDTHLRHARFGRDFHGDVADIRMPVAGDGCPRCEGSFLFFRGIEVGHVFLLGTRYSEPMKCTFLDVQGRARPMVMGCYGIGVTRVMAAAVEQNHDEQGIRWPLPIAPFEVAIVTLNPKDEEVVTAAESVYQELLRRRVDVLYDDRNERAGVKMKDAELIGYPYALVIGKRGMAEREVELRDRRSGNVSTLPLDSAVDAIVARLADGTRGQ